MIYSNEECQTLLLVEYRKTMERSVYFTIESLPIAFKSAMDCQLELDVMRCEAM